MGQKGPSSLCPPCQSTWGSMVYHPTTPAGNRACSPRPAAGRRRVFTTRALGRCLRSYLTDGSKCMEHCHCLIVGEDKILPRAGGVSGGHPELAQNRTRPSRSSSGHACCSLTIPRFSAAAEGRPRSGRAAGVLAKPRHGPCSCARTHTRTTLRAREHRRLLGTDSALSRWQSFKVVKSEGRWHCQQPCLTAFTPGRGKAPRQSPPGAGCSQ